MQMLMWVGRSNRRSARAKVETSIRKKLKITVVLTTKKATWIRSLMTSKVIGKAIMIIALTPTKVGITMTALQKF